MIVIRFKNNNIVVAGHVIESHEELAFTIDGDLEVDEIIEDENGVTVNGVSMGLGEIIEEGWNG